MAGLLTIAPAALLALGAAIAWRSPAADERLGRIGAPALVAAAFASAIAGAWQVLAGDGAPIGPQVLSGWAEGAGSAFAVSPFLQLDGLNVIALVLLTALAGIAAVHGALDDDPAALAAPLAVAAAAALLVAGMRSPLGLVAGWVALDLALAFAAGGGRSSLLAGQFGLLLLLGGLAVLPTDVVGAAADGTAPSEWQRLMLIGACLIRAGAWPIWWGVPLSRPEALWRSLTMRGGPVIAGLSLALMFAELSEVGAGISPAMLGSGIAAVAAASVLAFCAADRAAVADWRIGALAGLAVVAAGLADPVGRAIGVVLLAHVALAIANVYGSDDLGDDPMSGAARLLGAAAIIGAPPTLGFAARWLLFDQLIVRQTSLAVVVVFLGLALVAAPARHRAARASSPASEPVPAPARRGAKRGRALAITLTAAGIAGLVAGTFIGALAPVLDAATGTALPSPLLYILSTSWLRAPIAVLLAVAIPAFLIVGAMPLGWALRRLARGAEVADRTRLDALGTWLLLGGALAVPRRAFIRTGELLQSQPGIAGSRRAMAFTFTAAAAIGGALLSGAGSQASVDSGIAIDVPLWPTLAAAAIIVVLLLPRPPAARLIALLSTYALVATLSVAAGVPVVLALLPAAVGALVVGMIAISVMQAPIDRRLLSAARRLSALRGRDGEVADRLIPAFAIAIVTVAALGFGGGMPEALGEEVTLVVRPSIILVSGGILAVIFASTSLEVASGVMVALTGAELLYAALDHGLLITGALAAFQILLAVVISFFVGLSAPRSPSGGSALDPVDPRGAEPAAEVKPEVVGS